MWQTAGIYWFLTMISLTAILCFIYIYLIIYIYIYILYMNETHFYRKHLYTCVTVCSDPHTFPHLNCIITLWDSIAITCFYRWKIWTQMSRNLLKVIVELGCKSYQLPSHHTHSPESLVAQSQKTVIMIFPNRLSLEYSVLCPEQTELSQHR